MKTIHNIPCEVCGQDTGSSILINSNAKQSEIDRKVSGYKHARCAEAEPVDMQAIIRNRYGKDEQLKEFAAKWDGKPMNQAAIMEMFSIMRG